MPDQPIAYFITFTTYGTWLHGQAPGSVDREHNRFNTPWLAPNPDQRAINRQRMAQEPYCLDEPRRRVIRVMPSWRNAGSAGGISSPCMSVPTTCTLWFRRTGIRSSSCARAKPTRANNSMMLGLTIEIANAGLPTEVRNTCGTRTQLLQLSSTRSISKASRWRFTLNQAQTTIRSGTPATIRAGAKAGAPIRAGAPAMAGAPANSGQMPIAGLPLAGLRWRSGSDTRSGSDATSSRPRSPMFPLHPSRRDLLASVPGGIFGAALASLLSRDLAGALRNRTMI